jgi:predicted Abi (CAAX) family protease
MGNHDIEMVDKTRRIALGDISDRFGVVDTVKQLQHMMREVTRDKITSDTVNAACNCVQNLNLTIKTAIQAAKYLSEK